MRVGKLDSAFLFLLSLTGIIFAIVRVVSPPETSILYSVPLILFGVALPFYYGYFLGATGNVATSIGPLVASSIAIGIVAGVGTLTVLEFGSRLRDFVFEIVGDKRSTLTDRASIHTVNSALLLATATAILRDPRVVYLETGFLGLLAFLGILGLSAILGIYFLRKGEYYAKRVNMQFDMVQKYGRFYGRLKLPLRFALLVGSTVLIAFVVGVMLLAFGYVDWAITLIVLPLCLILIGLVLRKRLFSSRIEITFTT